MNEKMIAKLETKGFKRWTKGSMDRLYLNAQACGLEVTYYNTGNVKSARFDGEYISNGAGRRMLNQKTYIDLSNDSVHSTYWDDTFAEIAQALMNEAKAELESREQNPG